MHVNVRLIIFQRDTVGLHYCLLDNGEIPYINMITSQSTTNLCHLIMHEYLDIDKEWYIQFGFIDIVSKMSDDVLEIYYTCLIPSIIQNIKGEWVEIGKTNAEFQKMVFKGCQIAISTI